MKIFVDTSAFYALLDRDDDNQPAAKEAWLKIMKAENTLVTSNYILVETFALLQHRLGVAAVRAFQDDIAPILNVEFLGPDVHRSGMAAFLAASKRNLSLVDCTSFEILRSLGIRSVFAFDVHFREAGFQTVPRI